MESDYKYSQEEKDRNKVLKMQQEQLTELEKTVDKNAQELQKIRDKVAVIAKARGVNPNIHSDNRVSTTIKLTTADSPAWEDLAREANVRYPEDVAIEELLSREEFQFCKEEIARINTEFQQKTGIFNAKDMSFLAIATALQTVRWVIIKQIMGGLGEDNSRLIESSNVGDVRKKKNAHVYIKQHSGREHINSDRFPTWEDIVFGQYKRVDGQGKTRGNCPYDAQKNGPIGFDEGGKGMHRLNTLGHDPILGWIFGTANLMTCTITLSKRFAFGTYRVEYPGGVFGQQIPMAQMFYEVYESLQEDKMRLPAGLFAQYAHLNSDVLTNKGLPVPLLEAFLENIAGKLYREQYDSLQLLHDGAIVGTQAATSIIINMLIGLIHGLCYDSKSDGERLHYEVRTRKILSISNTLASAGNVACCALSEDWSKLDAGGILVTISRLFSDIRFITRVKQEYIEKELDKVWRKELNQLDQYFEQ